MVVKTLSKNSTCSLPSFPNGSNLKLDNIFILPKIIKIITHLDFTDVFELTALYSYWMIISICSNVLIIFTYRWLYFHWQIIWTLHLVHINHLPNGEIALYKPLISGTRLGWLLIWNLTIDTQQIGVGNNWLISVLEKYSLFHSITQVTCVLNFF